MTTYQEAQKKARYGHKDWIAYASKDAGVVCERYSRDAVKRALISVGTAGHFTVIAASTGIGHRYNWAMGILAMRNAKYLSA